MKFEREQPGPRLHRSIIFWSGLLVMGFIVWAWRDSTKTITYAAKGRWDFRNMGSGLMLTSRDVNAPNWQFRQAAETSDKLKRMRLAHAEFLRYQGGPRRLANGNTGTVVDARKTDAAVVQIQFMMELAGHPGDWILFIPYGGIMIGITPLWLGLLAWRWRRRRRATA